MWLPKLTIAKRHPIFATAAMVIVSLSLLTSYSHSNPSRLEERRNFVKSLGSKHPELSGSPRSRGSLALARLDAMGCADTEAVDYLTNILTAAHNSDLTAAVKDNVIFALPIFVRALYLFPKCVGPGSSAQIQRYIKTLRTPFEHGTINHAALQLTSHYLLAQSFPEAVWPHEETRLTSAQVMARSRKLLMARSASFFGQGYYEQNSPTYVAANFIPYLNLYDFASDPSVSRNADKMLTLILALAQAQTFRGAIVPPFTRGHVAQRLTPAQFPFSTPPALSQQALWYYFGSPIRGYVDIEDPREPFVAIFFSTSTWHLPSKVAMMADGTASPFDVQVAVPRFAYWGDEAKQEIVGNAYIANRSAIGGGNQYINPSGYNEHNQLFGIYYRSDDPFAVVDCYHPYWRSNDGEDAWLSDRSSPFQQYHRVGNRGVLVFDIPEKDPFVYGSDNRFFAKRNKNAGQLFRQAQCRFPLSIDQVVREPGAVYLREGKVFIALRALAGDFEPGPELKGEAKDFASIKINRPRTAIYFRVEEGADEHDFAAFMDKARIDQALYANGTATYPTLEGSAVSVTFSHRTEADGWIKSFPVVRINGVLEQVERPCVVDAPFLRLGKGKLEVLRDGIPIFELSSKSN